jgi:hypothetical protein
MLRIIALLAMANVAPATEAERQAALGGYVDCLVGEASKFDDGKSDPVSIGRLIMSGCDKQLEVMADAAVKGEKRPEQIKRLLLEQMRSDPEIAGRVVLMRRRAIQ